MWRKIYTKMSIKYDISFGGFSYQHKTFLFHFPLSLHKEQVQAILSNTAFLGGKQQMCQSHSSVQQPRIPARWWTAPRVCLSLKDLFNVYDLFGSLTFFPLSVVLFIILLCCVDRTSCFNNVWNVSCYTALVSELTPVESPEQRICCKDIVLGLLCQSQF